MAIVSILMSAGTIIMYFFLSLFVPFLTYLIPYYKITKVNLYKKKYSLAINIIVSLVLYRINPEKNQYKYKVELKYFYSEKKFQEVFNILSEKNILFVNNLKEEDFSDIPKETKNFDDAKQRFLDYKNGKFNWDIVTFANKGEKLSKIYSKSKKLMTIFSELYLEYMDDITNFDFLSLKSYGFKTPQIEEFIQKRDECYKECRI